MLIRLLTHRWLQVVLLLGLLAGAFILRTSNPPALENLRNLTFDYYNKLMPRQAHDDTLIVDIDEESLAKLGQWPWPRTAIGDLTEALKKMGAKAIVFDMVFAEPDRTSPAHIAGSLPTGMDDVAAKLRTIPDNDIVFADKIRAAGNVVTGFANADKKTEHQIIKKADVGNMGGKKFWEYVTSSDHFAASLPALTEAAAGNGSFSASPERDGIIRYVPLLLRQTDMVGNNNVYPALSLEGIRVKEGKTSYSVAIAEDGIPGIKNIRLGDHLIPTDGRGRISVYYAGHRPGLYVPAWKVLSGEVKPERMKDKIVFIGTSAIGLLDLRSSPLDVILPGVEIHAEVVEQILHDQYLYRPAEMKGKELTVAVVLSLLIIFLSPFLGTGLLSLLVGTLVAVGVVGSLYAYGTFGYLVDAVYPSLTVIVIFVASSILTNLRSEMEKRAVRQAFSHYISPVLMEELANDPEKLKLGGEVRELSIMFTDIRNFTTISQGMDPADLIKMMNDFLTPMTSCVLDNRGTVDKYMGDAMMAFWNAPLDDPDHARHACKSAMEMVKGLAPVNAALKAGAEKSGKPFKELKAGIGINSGMASVGNMGSKQRFAYSALGDAVNLASRVEGQTKGYGVSVMITEATRKGALEYAAIELDLLTVKGRTEPVRVYALLGEPETAQEEDFKVFFALHEQMLTAHRAQEWDKALTLGVECTKLRPDLAGLYNLYEERTATYKNSPPPHDWGGVWVAKEK